MRNIKVLRVSERKNFSHVYDDAYTVEKMVKGSLYGTSIEEEVE